MKTCLLLLLTAWLGQSAMAQQNMDSLYYEMTPSWIEIKVMSADASPRSLPSFSLPESLPKKYIALGTYVFRYWEAKNTQNLQKQQEAMLVLRQLEQALQIPPYFEDTTHNMLYELLETHLDDDARFFYGFGLLLEKMRLMAYERQLPDSPLYIINNNYFADLQPCIYALQELTKHYIGHTKNVATKAFLEELQEKHVARWWAIYKEITPREDSVIINSDGNIVILDDLFCGYRMVDKQIEDVIVVLNGLEEFLK